MKNLLLNTQMIRGDNIIHLVRNMIWPTNIKDFTHRIEWLLAMMIKMSANVEIYRNKKGESIAVLDSNGLKITFRGVLRDQFELDEHALSLISLIKQNDEWFTCKPFVQ